MRERPTIDPPLPHLSGGNLNAPNPTLQFVRSIVVVLIGVGIMAWELRNLNQKTSTMLTTGAVFVGFSLVLFGVYKAEKWKEKMLTARSKQRKEDAR